MVSDNYILSPSHSFQPNQHQDTTEQVEDEYFDEALMEFCDAETDTSQEECGSPSLLGCYADTFCVEDEIRRIVYGDKRQSCMEATKECCIAPKDSVKLNDEKVKTAKGMCVAPTSTLDGANLVDESQAIQGGDEGQSSIKGQKSSHVTPSGGLVDPKNAKDKPTQDTCIAPASTIGETNLVDESQTIQSIMDEVIRRKSSMKRKTSKKRKKKRKCVSPKSSVDLMNMKEESKEEPKEKKPKEKKSKEKPEVDMCIAPTSTVRKTDPCRTKNASAATVKPSRNIIIGNDGRITTAALCELIQDKLGQGKINSENLKKHFVADELHCIATFSRGFPVPKTWSKTKLIDCIMHFYSYGGSRLHLALLTGTSITGSTTGGIMLGSNLSQITACIMSKSGLQQPSSAVRPLEVDNYEEDWSDCPSPFDNSSIELRDALLAESKVSAAGQRTYTEI